MQILAMSQDVSLSDDFNYSDIFVQKETLDYVKDLLSAWAHWMLTESNGYPSQTPFADGGAMRTGFESQPPRGVKIPKDVAMLQSLIEFCELNGFYQQIGAVKIWYLKRREQQNRTNIKIISDAEISVTHAQKLLSNMQDQYQQTEHKINSIQGVINHLESKLQNIKQDAFEFGNHAEYMESDIYIEMRNQHKEQSSALRQQKKHLDELSRNIAKSEQDLIKRQRNDSEIESVTERSIAQQLGYDVAKFRILRYSGEKILAAQIELAEKIQARS